MIRQEYTNHFVLLYNKAFETGKKWRNPENVSVKTKEESQVQEEEDTVAKQLWISEGIYTRKERSEMDVKLWTEMKNLSGFGDGGGENQIQPTMSF